MPAWAAAAVQTERVLLGTAIIRTWTRHPIGFAQEALAFEQLAPGRLRLGIGPTGRGAAEQMYGGNYEKPLTYLREYLHTIRTLLHEGAVDFAGEYVTARTQLPVAAPTPVMASAAGPRAFALCGEVSDGAITWLAPKRYLVEQALPALRKGTEQAGRPAPSVIAHVPFVLERDVTVARARAREQLAGYAASPHFARTWAAIGHGSTAGLSDALLDQLIVSGDQQQVIAGLRDWLDAGAGEVLAHPLLDPADPQGSLDRAFALVARATAGTG